MNALSAFLVRTALLAALFAPAMPCIAQREDGSLTSGFDKLSAKERSKIAARETEEAGKDTAYQALMRNADHSFQAGRYEEALATFQQARVLRPYNVYPKVKIQDLQALIKKKELERAAQLKDTTQGFTEGPPPAAVPVEHPAPKPTEEAPVTAPPMEAAPAPLPKPAAAPQPIPPAQKAKPAQTLPSEPAPPTTLGERIYMEAGAVVTERTVEDDGKAVVYRKVAHSWGQTYYFKDGRAILQREWDQRFTGQ